MAQKRRQISRTDKALFGFRKRKKPIRRPQGVQTESCCCRELTCRVVIGEYIPLQQYNDLGGQISPDDKGKNGARGTILPQWQTNFWRQNEARWRIFLKQNDGSGNARNLARFGPVWSGLATTRTSAQTLHSRAHPQDDGSSRQLPQTTTTTTTTTTTRGLTLIKH